MAADDITVRVNSETKGFKQSVENGIIEPLEDAEKALKELGESKGPEQLERDMRDAQRETEDLQGELKQTARDLDKLGFAAKDAGRDGKAGLGQMKDGAQEVTQELGQNLGAAVSTVRGDLSDLGQVGQDTLGGLAATLAGAGPAGIAGAAALAAGAVGLGLITAETERAAKEAEKLRERLSAAYQEAAEAGREYLEVSQFIAESNDLMFNPERADEWKRLREDAARLGLDENTVIKANTGDLTAQKIVQQEINQFLESEDAHLDSIYGKNKGLSDEASELRDRWASINEETKQQAANAEHSRQVTSEFLKSAIRDAGEVSEEVDELGNKLITLTDGTEIVIDVETGKAHQNLDRFKGDADGVIDRLNGKDVKINVHTDTRALDAARRAFDDLQRRASRGIDIAFNRTGRQFLE